MVSGVWFKNLLRSVKRNFGRFVIITAIVLLGVSFVTGLSLLAPVMQNSINDYLVGSKVADIIMKSTSEEGFSEETVASFAAHEDVEAVIPFTVMDLEMTDGDESYMTRVYILPLSDMAFNDIEVTDGTLPSSAFETLAERGSNGLISYSPGDSATLSMNMGDESFSLPVTVSGVAANPLYFCKEPEIALTADSLTESGEVAEDADTVDRIFYLDSALIGSIAEFGGVTLPVTDVYIRLAGVHTDLFSWTYTAAAGALADELTELAGGEDAASALTLEENASYAILDSYGVKINVICATLFPIFFTAVALLVVMTSMTRLTEDERGEMACMRTLGFGAGSIMMKYVLFTLICCLIGGVVGIPLGMNVLPRIIYPVFSALFHMPAEMSGISVPTGGLVTYFVMIAATLAVTCLVTAKTLRAEPARMLQPKSPKAGGKTLLEKIPFIWNHLPFRYKSAFRNIFRYVKTLVLTIISVAGSSALVFLGLGLYDMTAGGEAPGIPAGMADSFGMISFVVIIASAALCILVIYNLTDMNISERRREIATLKVLGYQQAEVQGYIFREVMIMSVMGALLGLPVGCGIFAIVIEYLDFGALELISWYCYLGSIGIVIVFLLIAELLLVRKINKVDMTTSLKSVD